MNARSAFYLKIFLNRRHKGSQETLLPLLAPENAALFGREKSSETDLSHAFFNPDKILAKFHYSWLSDAIEKLPESKRPVYLAALPIEKQASVAKILTYDKPVTPIKGPLKRFIQKDLLQKLLPEKHIAAFYLPKSSMTVLLGVPKSKIVELIDFLGLYDLAEYMKKIVDTKLLRSLYTSLTPKQQDFLKSCMHQKDPLQSPRFPMQDWSGDHKELHLRLHKRGILRLSKALSGQNSILLWYITRKLDTGRGKQLEALIAPEEIPQVTAVVAAQVLQLLKFLEKD